MYRSSYNKIFGGVCSSIANTTGLPTFLIRLLVILLMVKTSLPIIAIYIVMWILLPLD